MVQRGFISCIEPCVAACVVACCLIRPLWPGCHGQASADRHPAVTGEAFPSICSVTELPNSTWTDFSGSILPMHGSYSTLNNSCSEFLGWEAFQQAISLLYGIGLRTVATQAGRLPQFLTDRFVVFIRDSCSSNLLSAAQVQSVLSLRYRDIPALQQQLAVRNIPIADLHINLTSLQRTVMQCPPPEVVRNDCTIFRDLLAIASDPMHAERNRTLGSLSRFLHSGKRVTPGIADNEINPNQPASSYMIVPASSRECLGISPTLSAFDILHFSAWASSPIFNDVNEYPAFFRLVPSDDNQVLALADLIEELGLTYLALVAGDDDIYSGQGYTLLLEEAARRKTFCFGVRSRFSASSALSIAASLRQLAETPEARAVVLFATAAQGEIFLHAYNEKGIRGRFLIGSEDWVNRVDLNQFPPGSSLHNTSIMGYLNNPAVTFPGFAPLINDFEYLLQTPERILEFAHNPFVRFYIEDEGDCSLPASMLEPTCFASQRPANKRPCTLDIMAQFPELPISFGRHMVSITELFFRLLSPVSAEEPTCWQGDCFLTQTKVSPDVYLRRMREMTGPCRPRRGELNRTCKVFTKTQSVYPAYSLQLLSGNGGRRRFRSVAVWDGEEGSTHFTRLTWNESMCVDFGLGSCVDMTVRRSNSSYQEGTSRFLPESVCSPPCPPGTLRRIPTDPLQFCCWTCDVCAEDHISNETNSEACFPCESGKFADSQRTRCQDPPIVRQPWSNGWTWVIVSMSAVNGVHVVFLMAYYTRHRRAPVIRAASYVHMMIIMLSVLASDVILPITLYMRQDSVNQCALQRQLYFLPITCMLVTFFLKTNLIRKLFRSTSVIKSSQLRGKLLSPVGQILTVIILTIVLTGIVSVAIVLSPSTFELVQRTDRTATYICTGRLVPDIVRLAICAVFFAAIFIVSFRTRNLPHEFNDSRLILTTSLIIFLIFIGVSPVVFSSDVSFRIVGLVLIGHSINLCTAIVMCTPRVYWNHFGFDNTDQARLVSLRGQSLSSSQSTTAVPHSPSGKKPVTISSPGSSEHSQHYAAAEADTVLAVPDTRNGAPPNGHAVTTTKP
ncbi:metabotropic glutamate receptor 3-like [Sycon ciliatum]|uniref:metabotropic glutamate receptor 3-like n=1 Tax=Sycon ciliatum TaxID=27933 RepID=UPI0031F63310